eukprot:571261-Pyramimonas_sp.AAC.1
MNPSPSGLSFAVNFTVGSLCFWVHSCKIVFGVLWVIAGAYGLIPLAAEQTGNPALSAAVMSPDLQQT